MGTSVIAQNSTKASNRSDLASKQIFGKRLGNPRQSASSLLRSCLFQGQKIWKAVAGIHTFIPGAVAAGLSIGMWQLGAWQPLEQLGYNAKFQMQELGFMPSPGWNDKIVVIGIDNASFDKYERFPLSRDRYAQLLQVLEPSKPAVIGFDILFVDKGQGDEEFASAISQTGNVVLSMAWDERGQPLKPLPEFRKNAAGIGQIWHSPDPDGISRRAALYAKNKPALGVAMLEVYNQQTPASLSKINLPQPIAGKKRQTVWLNWPGKAQSLTTYSFADVAEGKVPSRAFTGKLVLVGVTATAIDSIRSPFNQNSPTSGVYLHAALIDNLLNSKLLKPLDEKLILLLLLAVGLATCYVWEHRGVVGRLTLIVGLPLAWLLIACCALSCFQIWMPAAAPVGTMLLAGFGVQLRDHWEKLQERREKQLLMSLFEQYVAPEMASLIWQRKTEIFHNGHLLAQEQVATVLFMDIRGFTSISEKMPPGELFTWLNEYLNAMTECIMDRGGVVDKYIGDAIMAVFGVPFAHTEEEDIRQDALNAIDACMAMHKKLKQLNRRLRFEGKPQIKIGIGIHTGPVMAGSMGGSRRLNYSVVGDTVNVASRLESMNKTVTSENPYNLLISGKTYAYIRKHYRAQSVGATQLRGREKATMIYSILGKERSK